MAVASVAGVASVAVESAVVESAVVGWVVAALVSVYPVFLSWWGCS